MPDHHHLRRLNQVYIPHAVYFITTCTHQRRPILAAPGVAEILNQEWAGAKTRHGWLIGRFVIMPDHVHFFCAEQATGASHPLSRFMNHWKEWTAKAACRLLAIEPPFWQKQFFDHLLRRDESYAEKWQYVRDNPVRAGLVANADEWPFQGFIDFDAPRG